MKWLGEPKVLVTKLDDLSWIPTDCPKLHTLHGECMLVHTQINVQAQNPQISSKQCQAQIAIKIKQVL